MNKTEHLLTCLAEECAEVGQAAAKALREERDALHAALVELVTLKRMKDELSLMLLREEGGMGLDYDRRKPLAWQRALELVGPNVRMQG